ncbi:MAG: biopolymer transporter ExbD [Myxococcales bacterium]|nr:biopolymer transporter ExbD [Myxococcales bacterium]MCB9536479.1 biopolymer transporter ExbD [Myxococcales bacterium]
MAGGLNMDDDEGVNAINITPFVDVVLVLLIVFMVASSYIVKESIEVDLPKAATGGETLDTTLSLVVDAQGALFLNGEPTTEAAIAERCRAASKADENAQAIIAADKATPHGKVVRLIDLIRQNGVLKFAINIDPEEE